MLIILGKLLITIIIAIVVIFLLLVWLAVLLEGWDQKRIASLPKECKQALASAKKASGACLEMCQAALVTQSLVNGSVGNSSVESNDEDGPGEEELMLKTKTDTLEALEECVDLSVEGIELTTNARYVLLRGLYRAAKTTCENCRPTAGLKACPAREMLEKIQLET
ncbi:hypothetical protein MUP38_04640 [Candidatus Bathyarchaeota archaeon]|nr:hypothetical protein [Candidatus Bathyarchaeota archaeon]